MRARLRPTTRSRHAGSESAAAAGIHGTSESWSVGSRASHGGIRMHVSDVIDLYGRVPVGAHVLIR